MYPQYTWSVPELPALTAHLARNADLVQLATPGPMGLAGLIAARMLGLPVLAQYHTEVPEYAARLTGLPFVKDLVAPFVGWFYQQAELCLAPSPPSPIAWSRSACPRRGSVACAAASISRCSIRRAAIARCLARYGIARRCTGRAVRRPVVAREEPRRACAPRGSRFTPSAPTRACSSSATARKPTALDGPGVVRTGTLHGAELATVFASADVFAFASETETFGNVVVEAAASGLPAVVASAGAAHEHVIDGETGIVVERRSLRLARALSALLGDPRAPRTDGEPLPAPARAATTSTRRSRRPGRSIAMSRRSARAKVAS